MEDNRKSPRHSIHWRCAIIVEDNGKRETLQCRTSDINISGVSVICHRNVPPPHAVTVYLLIDPGNENHSQVIVEAQGSIMSNVLSGQQGGFRLGIQFTKFARDGKQLLQKNLPKDLVQSARRVTAADVAPVSDPSPNKEVVPTIYEAPTADQAPKALAI